MVKQDQEHRDFIAPVKSSPNPLLLKAAIGLFFLWVGVLLWVISRS